MTGVEKVILEQCYRYRTPIPEKILNAPELYLGLELYYTGFLDLSSSRSFGFAEGPISILSMIAYCDRFGFDNEQTEDFVYHISRLDNAYLKHRAEKLKSEK